MTQEEVLKSVVSRLQGLRIPYMITGAIVTEGLLEALQHRTMFNALHHDTGLKVDFWLKGGDEYDATRFQRRKKRKIFDEMIFITTAEDLMIIKLKWYKDSSSEKHYLDASGVYEIQRGNLDLRYMKRWLSYFSVLDLFERIKTQS
jgi:hypothetical protein